MEKPADTQYPIHDLLQRRWSPVAFSERDVSEDDLRSILEAARWAPSCYNDQPWHFILAPKSDREGFPRMLGCLVEQNVAWAQHAPVLGLAAARLNFTHNGQENRHAFHDIGMAIENMMIQAVSLGLFLHAMAGFSAEKAREAFAVPDGYETVTAFALGYASGAEHLPEALRQRDAAPRSRKPLTEWVFAGRWGKISPLVS